MKVSRVDVPRCLLGEGPVWSAAEQALYYLDIFGQKVHRYEPRTGSTRAWGTPLRAGALALRAKGGLVLAMQKTLQALDLETGKFSQLSQIEGVDAEARFNDGKVDRTGRFLLGLSDGNVEHARPIGGLCSAAADHKITMIDPGTHLSNSPCVAPDNRTVYFADSFLYSLFAYDYDPVTGKVANKRLFANTRELGGMPDGATVDSQGRVWMAIFNASKVVCFGPDGKVERTVPIPAKMASAVMFGGPDLDRLYVTSIDPGAFGGTPDDNGGYLYVVDGLGVRGVAEPSYAG